MIPRLKKKHFVVERVTMYSTHHLVDPHHEAPRPTLSVTGARLASSAKAVRYFPTPRTHCRAGPPGAVLPPNCVCARHVFRGSCSLFGGASRISVSSCFSSPAAAASLTLYCIAWHWDGAKAQTLSPAFPFWFRWPACLTGS
jgi:hypothetical protein